MPEIIFSNRDFTFTEEFSIKNSCLNFSIPIYLNLLINLITDPLYLMSNLNHFFAQARRFKQFPTYWDKRYTWALNTPGRIVSNTGGEWPVLPWKWCSHISLMTLSSIKVLLYIYLLFTMCFSFLAMRFALCLYLLWNTLKHFFNAELNCLTLRPKVDLHEI